MTADRHSTREMYKMFKECLTYGNYGFKKQPNSEGTYYCKFFLTVGYILVYSLLKQ